MPSTSIIDRLRGERSTLVDRFAEAIVVEGGRRDGSAETRVTIDLRHPELADDGGSGGRERWRLRTARHRLAASASSPAGCWLLCMIGLAIDRRTVENGRIGVVLDAAIALKQVELADLGFRRGRRRDGYKGAYYELAA
jgi:hypothetical protein